MIGRIPVTDVRPVVACGRWPARAVVGETVTITATVLREGHDAVGANVVICRPDATIGPYTPMRELDHGLANWEAQATFDRPGRWSFCIEAWGDPIATWHHNVEVKHAAAQDVALELEEGARLFADAATCAPAAARPLLLAVAKDLRDDTLRIEDRLARALSPDVAGVVAAHPLRTLVTQSDRYDIWVDREQALFSAWYEFFPRSEGAHQDTVTGRWRTGTFRTAAERLPAVAAMGFDVVYLPPVHPIGEAFRKGPNNTLNAEPGDPGSPWAIGGAAGGHDAVHPDLGTIDDFDAFVARARELGMEVALDLALQASPDHPWAREHPEWFTVRADGSIAYAENPPKKYQDIYPVNFDNDPDGIYAEVLRIVRHWMRHGVRVFRVDNPHTKPVKFWEWLIWKVKGTDPDVLFLAEAFTRPPMMHLLAQIGFTQSYTYFTWRNTKYELEEYVRELSGRAADYMRPNFFVNTPDILHAYLQYGGPAAFKTRAVLAALLSPSWGVYSGYELFEHEAVRAGSEEYMNSEKYQYRPRDWAAAEAEGRSLAPYLTMLNRLRREHPALQRLRNVRFHTVDGDDIMCFSKRLPPEQAGGREDTLIVVVNLDPHAARESTVHLDLPELGFDWGDGFRVRDEVTGADYLWGEHNYVRLDPFVEPAHVFTVHRGW
jgi:starch synthase (maltosyl-transferring)